ncbi:MAG: NB-ARC domain-containing protein, partial [Ktedonobacteraceae bacterium]
MKKANDASPNRALKHERSLHCWSQLEVADRIGTTAFNVSRWERGVTFPGSYFRQQLCAIFAKSPQELGFLNGDGEQDSEEAPISAPLSEENSRDEQDDHVQVPVSSTDVLLTTSETLPLIWNVPYRHNPFFTGREEILQALHVTFNTDNPALTHQALAISGLGGIGKTQTALAYTYRYRQTYQAVLWVRADTRELLIADFASVATLLGLPEKNDQDQSHAVLAVKRWLSRQTGWLLVLDNADDLEMVSDFIPEVLGGDLLLTTRAQSTGHIALRIPMEKLSMDEGVLFLLRRAKLVMSTGPLDTTEYEYWMKAKAIAEIMDGLPLALDQAAAYIEETGCGLAGYVERYQQRRIALLRRRGGLRPD